MKIAPGTSRTSYLHPFADHSTHVKVPQVRCTPGKLPVRPPLFRLCHLHHRSRYRLQSAPPQFNPQNVPDPQVMPQKDFTPEEAVAAQMDALLFNDSPWPNHGIQTMYEFGWDIGGMERSRYFGYSKDLYHFDHFLGQFWNAFGELVDAESYEIGESRTVDDEAIDVDVCVKTAASQKPSLMTFRMQRKEFGRREGSWMTKTILKQQ